MTKVPARYAISEFRHHVLWEYLEHTGDELELPHIAHMDWFWLYDFYAGLRDVLDHKSSGELAQLWEELHASPSAACPLREFLGHDVAEAVIIYCVAWGYEAFAWRWYAPALLARAANQQKQRRDFEDDVQLALAKLGGQVSPERFARIQELITEQRGELPFDTPLPVLTKNEPWNGLVRMLRFTEWLILAEPRIASAAEVLKHGLSGVLSVEHNLRQDLANAIRNCLKRTRDVSQLHLDLL